MKKSNEIPDYMDAVDIMKLVERASIERTNKMRDEVEKLFANLISKKYPELKVEYNLVWKDMNYEMTEELANKIKEKMEEDKNGL